MTWNYRIATKLQPRLGTDSVPDRVFKIISAYYDDNGNLIAYGELPALQIFEDTPSNIFGTINQFNDMVARDGSIIDLDNWPKDYKMKKDHRFDHFMQKMLFFEKFENFQLYMAERGIHCFIIPDGYKLSNESAVWRGFVAYKKSGEWIEDDIGATSLHEIMAHLKRVAVEIALQLKIKW
jgi:hypothetical protein